MALSVHVQCGSCPAWPWCGGMQAGSCQTPISCTGGLDSIVGCLLLGPKLILQGRSMKGKHWTAGNQGAGAHAITALPALTAPG